MTDIDTDQRPCHCGQDSIVALNGKWLCQEHFDAELLRLDRWVRQAIHETLRLRD